MCAERVAVVFVKIRRPWSDIKVLMSRFALQCDMVTANFDGDLKILCSFKGQIPDMCYTPSAFRGDFWLFMAAILPGLNKLVL